MDLVLALYKEGRVDFNRVFTTQSVLVTRLDQLAVARGNIALSVISIYRALGGGWRVSRITLEGWHRLRSARQLIPEEVAMEWLSMMFGGAGRLTEAALLIGLFWAAVGHPDASAT